MHRLGMEKSRDSSRASSRPRTEHLAPCDERPGGCPTPPQAVPHQKHPPVRGSSISLVHSMVAPLPCTATLRSIFNNAMKLYSPLVT